MKLEQIQAVHRNGNLHIKIFGDFDSMAAHTATAVINARYQGAGNVFVNTEKMGAVLEAGVEVFRHRLKDCVVQRKNFFLIGEKGMAMAPRGSRVIIPPKEKCKCGGKCKNCSCRKEEKTKPEGNGK